MRFMVLMIPNVYRNNKPEAGKTFSPSLEAMARMGQFNEGLMKAGAIVTLDGLKPLTAGARLTYAGGKATVTDGPYVEAKEVLGGYWLMQAKSKEEVVEWMKRCPAEDGDIIEVRPIFEMADFPSDVQQAFEGQKS